MKRHNSREGGRCRRRAGLRITNQDAQITHFTQRNKQVWDHRRCPACNAISRRGHIIGRTGYNHSNACREGMQVEMQLMGNHHLRLCLESSKLMLVCARLPTARSQTSWLVGSRGLSITLLDSIGSRLGCRLRPWSLYFAGTCLWWNLVIHCSWFHPLHN